MYWRRVGNVYKSCSLELHYTQMDVDEGRSPRSIWFWLLDFLRVVRAGRRCSVYMLCLYTQNFRAIPTY